MRRAPAWVTYKYHQIGTHTEATPMNTRNWGLEAGLIVVHDVWQATFRLRLKG